jgi:hypothetical protein
MHPRIILVAIVLSFLTLGSGSAQTDSSAPLHTFYGQVKAVDLKARTLTIKSNGKSFLFYVTDETKISGQNEFARLDKVKLGDGAAVVMRLGEGNKGIAVRIRFDADASLASHLALLSARTTRGEMISGIAVNNFVAYEPPAHEFRRGLDFGSTKLRMFRLSVQPDGTVANATPFQSFGYEELDARAAKWLMKWRFRPNSVTEVRIPVVSSRTFR